MKSKDLQTEITTSIPASPSPGTLYVSFEYRTAVHLCACGCGTKVVTPLGPNDWTLTFDGAVSLRPSVGNGQQPCRSHYFIRRGQIDWLPRISTRATESALVRDRAAHAAVSAGTSTSPNWWRRLWNRVQPTSAERG